MGTVHSRRGVEGHTRRGAPVNTLVTEPLVSWPSIGPYLSAAKLDMQRVSNGPRNLMFK